MAAQHRIACDHESEFFREWIMESSGGRVDKSALYYAYVNEMRDSGYHPKGRSNFNLALRQAFPDLQGRFPIFRKSAFVPMEEIF